MKLTMQWGVSVVDDKKSHVTVNITPNKAEAAAKAIELGGKLVRVRCLS